MSEILDTGSVSGLRISLSPAAPISLAIAYPGSAVEDTVEISPLGKAYAEIAEPSTFRKARIGAIRSEVLAGSYETSERIDGTVERLIDVLC